MKTLGIVLGALVMATVVSLPSSSAGGGCRSAQVVDAGGIAYVGLREDGSVFVAAESNGQAGLQPDEYLVDTSATPCH